MTSLKQARNRQGISQRRLANLSALSFRSVQLMEGGGHDGRISSLDKVAEAMHYPKGTVLRAVENVFVLPPLALKYVARQVLAHGTESWKIWLFDFVDAFRRERDLAYVAEAPALELSEELQALFTSTAETLCDELNLPQPWWAAVMPRLKNPWFVSGVENLKAMALVESPVHFRKRNVFVLGNFLERA